MEETKMTFEEKRQKVLSLLGEFKKYDFRLKAYYLWASMKYKVTNIEIDKMYDTLMESIKEVKQEELNKKLGTGN